MMKKIAVIGAGLSGLTLAHQLSSHADVTLFEKSRGVSGRMSTRRAEPYHFDHGAQFFKAKTLEFQAFLQPMIERGVVAPWAARFVEFDGAKIVSHRQWDNDFPHYVGVPAMNAMNKYLAAELDVRLGTRIVRLDKQPVSNSWRLIDEHGDDQGSFDWVVSTAPPVQTAELMPTVFQHHEAVSAIDMQACFSLMLGFEAPIPLDFDAALVRHADISWISVNNTKPDRPESFSLLVHSTNDWASVHIDDERDAVIAHLLAETERVIGLDLSSAQHQAVHGWRFANIGKQSLDTPLIDVEHQLAACGDWCIQGRVEAAFSSSLALSNELLVHL